MSDRTPGDDARSLTPTLLMVMHANQNVARSGIDAGCLLQMYT